MSRARSTGGSTRQVIAAAGHPLSDDDIGCWKCDNPQASDSEYHAQMWDKINRFGWAVQFVGAGRIAPPFAYTVGLSGYAEPELVVTGMRQERAGGLLNRMAAHMLAVGTPRVGEHIQHDGDPLVEFVELTNQRPTSTRQSRSTGRRSGRCNSSTATTAGIGRGIGASAAAAAVSRCWGDARPEAGTGHEVRQRGTVGPERHHAGMNTFTIVPTGAYSLRESAEFGFGGRSADRFDGVMRLAFCVDGYRSQVGVELRQDGAGVHGTVHGATKAELGAVRDQVARVLSLDHDAAGFADVGRRDEVIGRLQEVAPGLLPPLFYSPYEAAAWAVISARRPANQMAEVRRRLSEEHGRVFQLAGRQLAAVPTPEQMLRIAEFPGLTGEKLDRLHGIARKALSGILDVERLRHIGPEATTEDMQRLKGIGPFYASLITIRAVGFADVPPADEPMLRDLVTQLYHLPEPCTREQFLEIAEAWRPYRTWAAVLIRAASGRLAEPPVAPDRTSARRAVRSTG